MQLNRFSFGVGDRFAHQAKAQLRAFQELAKLGVSVTPVWNKSNREHSFVGSEPPSVKKAAEEAVKSLGWETDWHVDADHIQLATVDKYLDCSDFFTIDVADFIGKPVSDADVEAFINAHPELEGQLTLEGIDTTYQIDRSFIQQVAQKFLGACQAAGEIYRHIAAAKGEDQFIAEVSMDETDSPQTLRSYLLFWPRWPIRTSSFRRSRPSLQGDSTKGSTTLATSSSSLPNSTPTLP